MRDLRMKQRRIASTLAIGLTLSGVGTQHSFGTQQTSRFDAALPPQTVPNMLFEVKRVEFEGKEYVLFTMLTRGGCQTAALKITSYRNASDGVLVKRVDYMGDDLRAGSNDLMKANRKTIEGLCIKVLQDIERLEGTPWR